VEGSEERAWEGEYGANTVYTWMQMEKWDLLKLFQEWGVGALNENDGGGEFNYSIFDIL
jgi:hypothetical protein